MGLRLEESFSYSLGGEAKAQLVSEGLLEEELVVGWLGADRRLRLGCGGAELGAVELPVSPSALRFDVTASKVLVGAMSGAVCLLDLPTGHVVAEAKAGGAQDRFVTALAQSPSHPSVWAVSSGALGSSLRLWDSRSPAPASAALPVSGKRALCVEMSPQDPSSGAQEICVGCEDAWAYCFDVRGMQLRTKLGGHSGGVSCLRYSPAEMLLASGSEDKTVRWWDVESGECVSQSDPLMGPVLSLAFHDQPDALWILSQGCLRLSAFEPARTLASLPTPFPPSRLVLHARSRTLHLFSQPNSHIFASHTLSLDQVSIRMEEPEEKGFHLHPTPEDEAGPPLPSPQVLAPELVDPVALAAEKDAAATGGCFRPRPKLSHSPPQPSSPLHTPPNCPNWSSQTSTAADSIAEAELSPAPSPRDPDDSSLDSTIYLPASSPAGPAEGSAAFVVREDVSPLPGTAPKGRAKPLGRIPVKAPGPAVKRTPPPKALVKPQPASSVASRATQRAPSPALAKARPSPSTSPSPSLSHNLADLSLSGPCQLPSPSQVSPLTNVPFPSTLALCALSWRLGA